MEINTRFVKISFHNGVLGIHTRKTFFLGTVIDETLKVELAVGQFTVAFGVNMKDQLPVVLSKREAKNVFAIANTKIQEVSNIVNSALQTPPGQHHSPVGRVLCHFFSNSF